ncbi:MAG: alpha/beta hydrolase [Thiohalocapsa sp.]
MLRFLVRFSLFVVAVALIALAVGPLLIDPTPASGATSAETLAHPGSRFVELPFPGTGGIELHYLELEQVGPEQQDPNQLDPQPPGLQTPSAEPPEPSATETQAPRTFVLLHGFTFNAFTWNRMLDVFAVHGRVLAYDQIPYGLSAKPVPGTWHGASPYSKAAALEHLMGFLDGLGIERVILVGNSSGGTLALEAAVASPERVEGLVLLSPWVHANRPIFPEWLTQLPQMRRLTLLLARYLGGDSPLLDYSYADPSQIDEQRRALTGVHREMANWDAAWAALLNHSLTDPVEISAHLGGITQPVLVITGAADQVVPVADSDATAAELPNAQFALLPDCGHVPQEECPQRVAEVITQWLDTLPPEAP